jgi:hypothetical protein
LSRLLHITGFSSRTGITKLSSLWSAGLQCVTAAPEPSHAFDALVQRTYPHVRPNASLRCHSSSTVTMARQSRPAQRHGINHAVANGRNAHQHAMRGTAVAQTSKENVPHVHADGAVCDAIRRSNCECCKVWNSNHGHARDCPVAPQYRTATRTSRTSMAAEGIDHALPSVESSGPSAPHSSCALPCLQANREQSTTAHECGGRSMCRRSMRASDHTLHPSGKWGQAFRLESASIIWGKKIM